MMRKKVNVSFFFDHDFELIHRFRLGSTDG
jgi:hypothetical protein